MLLLAVLTTALAGDPFDGALAPTAQSASELVYEVGAARVRLVATPGPDESGPAPHCRGGGVDLLVDGPLDDAGATLVTAACARLDVHAPRLARTVHAPPQRDAPKPVLPPDPVRSAFDALAVLWVAALGVALARAPRAWLWTALALAVRVAFAEPVALMGKDYPYAHLMGYAGTITFNPLYGYGWYAVMDVARAVLGAAPDRLHVVNMALSALTVPALWCVLDRLAERRVADVGAALLAVLPLAVSLAGSEVHHVLCALLEATAVLGALRADRTGDALAVSSAVLLTHARPDQAPFAAVVAALLLVRRRHLALLATVGGLAWRAAQIGVPNGRDGFPNPAADALSPGTLAAQWWGPGSGIAVLDPWVQPVWLLPLACVGAARLTGTARAVLAACVAASVLPTAHMYFPTDVLRFQLPAATWWVALAAVPLSQLPRVAPAPRALAAALVVAGLWVARAPTDGLVTRAEHRFLRTELARLPAATVVRYDDVWDDAGLFRSWAQAHAGVVAVPFTAGPVQAGEVIYVGVAARLPGRITPSCTGTTLAQATTPPRSGALLPIDDDAPPVTLSLVRATTCTTP